MATVTMQSPWVTYTNKIREFFKRDPEIKMTWSDETLALKMYVNNAAKADAISKILPSSKTWGAVTITITVIPANKNFATVSASTIDDAFAGNPIYSFTKTFPDAFLSNPVTYVVFTKEVIQWWNDDLGDLYGQASMLAEDMARDIFENVEGIFFCTDVQ